MILSPSGSLDAPQLTFALVKVTFEDDIVPGVVGGLFKGAKLTVNLLMLLVPSVIA